MNRCGVGNMSVSLALMCDWPIFKIESSGIEMFKPITLLVVALLSGCTLGNWSANAQEQVAEEIGRIEGRVLAVPQIELLPKVTAHSVELFVGSSGRPFAEAKIDAEGGFVFENVPAGGIRLQPLFRVGDNDRNTSVPSALLIPTFLSAGSTMEVAFLGEGRPVEGRIILPQGVKPEQARVWLQLLAPPFRAMQNTNGRRSFSPEAVVYEVLTKGSLESELDDNGRFTISGVREGNYRILVTLTDEKSDRLVFANVVKPGSPFVTNGVFVVPFMAGGSAEKPHDLGTLEFARRTN